MTIALRPFNPETDFARFADLTNTYASEPVTAEELMDDDEKAPRDQFRRRIVAVDHTGQILGFNMAFREPWSEPGHFHLRVAVDPARRHRGIGSLLFEELLQCLRDEGAIRLNTWVRDNDPESLRFSEYRGFHVNRHLFQSRLNLTGFDESRFVGTVETAEAAGFRFFTMASLDDSPVARRNLFELEGRVIRDVPGWEPGHWPPPFEQYCKTVFEADWYRADGQIIAADGERWVGMCAVGFFQQGTYMHHNFTGVDSAYRGRGLALALKLLSIRCARKHGATYMSTGNDSLNAPMLAINRKLGFRPEAGRYTLLREFTPS